MAEHRQRYGEGNAMKCKSHPYEQGVGVCASCLRERLLALVAAQNELSANHHRRRRSDPPPQPPPPLVFPRSSSPYVSHRRSVGFDASPAHPHPHHNTRFFSTPQVGPTFGDAADGGRFGEISGGRRRRFSLRTIFGHHRSDEAEPGLGAPKGSAPGSWFSALIRGRRKKAHLSSAAEEEEEEAPPVGARRSLRTVERGMPPTMEYEDDNDDGNGYTSDKCRRRPTPTPMRLFPAAHRPHRSISAVSGFSACLSPLVRFRSDARRSHTAEPEISRDISSPSYPIQHWNPAALGPNLSRNVAASKKLK
ncbi:uncharacterized protein LOC135624482 [Musa acuminata AAA Group]|uniref:uncharacterized protein LOC135624482 n=1 Tax=Musa acuminata AAA Group TaxID=214697 RepID=UPI0031DFB4A7